MEGSEDFFFNLVIQQVAQDGILFQGCGGFI